MTPSWTPEKIVDGPLAKRLIEAQFPTLAPVALHLLGAGWDNTVYSVNERYVFRFPRRTVAVQLLETEAHVLPALASRLPIAVPAPEFVGHPTDEFEWPFVGYPFLPGHTACRAHLTASERHAIAKPLAQALRVLHDISAEQAEQLGAPPDLFERLEPKLRVPKIADNLRKARQIGLVDEIDSLIALVEPARSVKWAGQTTLVHGDLYSRHLLIDSNRHLCGIIDWGDLHVGNPPIDLSVVYDFLPKEAHPVFFEIYGSIDETTKTIAQMKALYQLSILILFAHDQGDVDLLKESQLGLQFMR